MRNVHYMIILTTPMASRANSTVPKKSGKFATSPNATRFSNDNGSRKIKYRMIAIPVNMIIFASVENGAKNLRFLM